MKHAPTPSTLVPIRAVLLLSILAGAAAPSALVGVVAPSPSPASPAAGPVAASATVQSAPAPPAPGAQEAAPPADALLFGSDMGIVINPVRPDKTADFEKVMARLREALDKSPNPIRQRQGAGWKILKAVEPGPGGSVLYLFVLDPPVKNADYTVSRILAEAFPDEIDTLWVMLRDSYAGGLNRLTLQTLIAPQEATPPVKSTR